VKVIHIVGTISVESSGPSKSVPTLCSGLADLGVDVKLFYLDLGSTPSVPGVDTRVYAQTRIPGLRFAAWSAPMLLGLLRETTSDVVLHAHGMWHFPTIFAAWAKALLRPRLVVSPRGTLGAWPLSQSPRKKALALALGQRYALRRADLLHATAESEVHDLRRFGLDRPVVVIPNPITVPDLPERWFELQKPQVLFLARIHPIKACDRLLRAWELVQVRWPEWKLIIAGPAEGGHLEELQRLAQELGLRSAQFVGELRGAEKERAFRSSRVFVLPSHNENFGMAIAEALGYGVPVVASHGTPWEVLKKEGAGYWVDNKPESIAHALEQAMGLSVEQRARMGAAGRRIVETRFSPRAIAEQMKRAYEELPAPNVS
jgi:glycosyltransferase involved in cell wall biosynthesis